jgi:hypothetical protein
LFFQFLQKIYKEDLDEVALEADEDLKNERKAAKETVGVKAHLFPLKAFLSLLQPCDESH